MLNKEIFEPTVLIESNTDNYQAYYRIKADTKEEIIALSKYLNEKYGNSKQNNLSNILQLPDFFNNQNDNPNKLLKIISECGKSYDIKDFDMEDSQEMDILYF